MSEEWKRCEHVLPGPRLKIRTLAEKIDISEVRG